MDTFRNAFATIVLASTAFVIGWEFPSGGLGKTVVGAISWIIIQSIVLLWIYRTLPKEPAKAIADGIAPEDQIKFGQTRIQNLVAQLDNQQLAILAAYGSDHVDAQMQKIRPPLATGNSPAEVKDRSDFFDWCESELMRLGLLRLRLTNRRTGGFIEITRLGRSVLRAAHLLAG